MTQTTIEWIKVAAIKIIAVLEIRVVESSCLSTNDTELIEWFEVVVMRVKIILTLRIVESGCLSLHFVMNVSKNGREYSRVFLGIVLTVHVSLNRLLLIGILVMVWQA